MSVDRGVSLPRIAALVAGVSVLGLLFAGVATATIPTSTTGQYVACYRTSNGAVRMIDVQKGGRCYGGEKKIAWGPSYVWRGTYNPAAGYNPGAVVVLNGSSYVARLAVPVGQAPAGTGTTYWGLLAARGADGQPGAPGTSMLLGPNKLIGEARVAPNGFLDWSRTTNGAAMSSSRTAVGRYTLRVPGFQTANGYLQSVHVQSYGGLAYGYCKPTTMSATPQYVDISISCVNAYTGVDVDSYFFVQVMA